MSKFMISTVVVIVIAALIIVAFSLQVRTNKLLEENENLKDELSDIEYTNEQLEKELDKEIDDEYEIVEEEEREEVLYSYKGKGE